MAQTAPTPTATPWWKGAVLYEIYPRSFQDSNGDGVGDLNGITSRLDYLQKLGIDGIWIAPAYPSPQVDFGYDISDYEAIDPQYGTMADFEKLVAAAKQRHIRVLMDMVLNHTSDKDPWFVQSKSSRTDPKRDWYVWRDPKGYDKDGKPIPPNNWQSVFGHSAWEWDAGTKQFYYHRFYVQQPDLNWRNPAVEKAMFDVLRFWLDKGVAGFRLDAIPSLFEDPAMRNEPEKGGTNAYGDPNLNTIYTDNLPEVHGVIARMRKVVAAYPDDRVLIGETYLPNVEELDKWYGGAAKNELQLPMDMLLGFGSGYAGHGKLDATFFRNTINAAETKLQGSEPLFVFSNHDNPRDWDRYSDGVHDLQIAKILATMLLTTRDTALLYYGEELGMKTHTPTRVEDVQDPIGKLGWPKEKGRDGERTPMQWTADAQAGFSTNAHTWLPVAADHTTLNVVSEEQDPNSLLRWYQQLTHLRDSNPAFAPDAKINVLMNTAADVLAYTRAGADGKLVLVAINMSDAPQTLDTSAYVGTGALHTLAASNAPQNNSVKSKQVTLPPFSVWVAEQGQ
ncbi:alpha-glucosidase [Acidipila sp. EB88]|uniref:alpha-glucosidase n=1 Tax=Acidipila sp. EB88 TaxID=2305226 RepID=UPI0035198766